VSLKITTREVDGVTILDVVGRITLGKETLLRHKVRDLAAQGKKKILLNLAKSITSTAPVSANWWQFHHSPAPRRRTKAAELEPKSQRRSPRHQALHRLRCQGRRVHRVKSFDWFSPSSSW